MLNKGSSTRFLAIIFACSLVVNAMIWVGVWRLFPQDSPVAVLHYSIGVGIDFIGAGDQIKALPLVGLVLLVLNAVLGYGVARVSPLAAWIFWLSVPLVQLILAGAFIILWRLNS